MHDLSNEVSHVSVSYMVVTANLPEVVRCDFLALEVNVTNARNRFINQEPANFIK